MLTLISQEPFSAVTVADLRQHLNIVGSQDDAYLATLLDAAVVYAERWTGMDFASKTWQLVLDRFPGWSNYWGGDPLDAWPGRQAARIDLRRGPLQSIDSIEYRDAANVLQEIGPEA